MADSLYSIFQNIALLLPPKLPVNSEAYQPETASEDFCSMEDMTEQLVT